MVSYSVKQRNPETGQWCDLLASAFVGKTIGQLFIEQQGREVVAEVVVDNRRLFFCGTEFWRERMSRKGDAYLVESAAEILGKLRPDLLVETIPHLDQAVAVFGDCTLINHACEGKEQPCASKPS